MKEAGGADGENGGETKDFPAVLADGHVGATGGGRASALAKGWVRLAATVAVLAGVAIAVGDGNEFDDVDCGVAAKPPGYSKGQDSARGPSGLPPGGGILPDVEGGGAGGPDDLEPLICADETLMGAGVIKTPEVVKMLRGIREEIASVRKEFVELRTAKKRLEGMLGDGLFGFTQKVDARSFKVLCAILAEGDVAKASRALEMPDASVRTLMRRWSGMGKEYRAMADLVRWRKAVGRRETVSLNENVLLEKAARVDYPGLLADVLDGLLSMTEENWQERCEELADLLRPVADG